MTENYTAIILIYTLNFRTFFISQWTSQTPCEDFFSHKSFGVVITHRHTHRRRRFSNYDQHSGWQRRDVILLQYFWKNATLVVVETELPGCFVLPLHMHHNCFQLVCICTVHVCPEWHWRAAEAHMNLIFNHSLYKSIWFLSSHVTDS